MIAFALIALVTLGTAAAAMALRNLIHSVLLLIASWAGIAAFYLWAGAEFVAFAQVLVYVGAVSMIVLFAVLLTRRSRDELVPQRESVNRAFWALITGGALAGVLFGAVSASDLPASALPARPVPVRALGVELMTAHAAALLIAGLLLTVALIGGIVMAATGIPAREEEPSQPG